MSLRRKARSYALQMLFQWEVGRNDLKSIEEGFWARARSEKSTRAFANELFEGAAAGAAELDALLAENTKNWRAERLASTDRAILRLAAYELRAGKTPPKVVLNEAIELAKEFSSQDAAGFINGVLDAVARSLGKKGGASKAATQE
jgi:N utilization substance protein B